IRDRGVLGREVAGGMIENVYRLQMIKTSESPLTLKLSATGVPELAILTADEGTDTVQLDAASNRLVPVVARARAGALAPGLRAIESPRVGNYGSGRDVTVVERSSFLVPRYPRGQ